ncbi:MAG: ABC transporter ATP-binding protein [Chromatiaceae bacterium]|nr:ABC transporter ATP-binding protein [Chromatiaceae bacterium]
MSDTAIIVENLGKSYLVGHQAAQAERYTALRDVVARNVRTLARKTRDMLHGRPIVQGDEVEEFWALKDVSFEVKQGETLGIIGRNGAGKSTLLKVLSRITEPTQGRITLNGRVASLLEVGTGFHPELTGRENIFLNGAILGMTRREIQRKFDEIVAFAEVEQFLDTPVKRYSSGMYVRLAFAVAAHLEPEILVVDEVLAVGDAVFQKKCLGKMGQVAQEGRTVLFVSHNMAAVSNLCSKGLILSSGSLGRNGDIHTVIRTYMAQVSNQGKYTLSERRDRQGTGTARFADVIFLDADRNETQTIMCGEPVGILITLASDNDAEVIRDPIISIGIDNSAGYRVLHLSNEAVGSNFLTIDINRSAFYFHFRKMPLIPDSYSITLFLSSNNTIIDWVQQAAEFRVESGDYHGSGKLPPPSQGVFLAEYSVTVSANHV